ncbi:TIGR03915 family putative DNA repair protein [Alkaliphilus serpentinus]|uniref:DNA metabolism protein n=1 Tax=Alkaliphilus serpentinus TaxID=1482731 RepID=A0A833HR03_9FIRM|nr:TIGR03915 family putative DNA repair protein [Alkaliphilus serpentinus]KAB3532714.1 DNA metabolism protein [Alkaliphilus serpentinus]
MVIYVFDGSFEGFLTAIYESYYNKEKPDKIVAMDDYVENLIDRPIFIETDEIKSDKVYAGIKNKISTNALKKVYHVFLSEVMEAPTVIYHYLRLGFKIGNKVDLNLMDDWVLRMDKINQQVASEKHRMLGLLRFQLVENDLYYAPLAPDHNIIALMANHFAQRMSDQKWMIHDTKRCIAVVYDLKEWIITPIDLPAPPVGKEEYLYQQLWKEYYQSIAIKERRNPRLQKRCMPVRYWSFLTEKK